MAEVACPNCGNNVPALQNIDGALAAKLKESGIDPVPSQACPACVAQMMGGRSGGSVLMAREKAREQKKVMLWKSRVNLVKKARNYMNDKMYSDAAVSYEKYLRVLEVVFDAKPGDLNPEHFKDSAKTQELTVVASAYWDLIRIYDTSPKYGERQKNAITKLAQFLRFTPIFPDIVRKAEAFQKSAKHPELIKAFLKQATDEKGRCFIATAAFESPFADEVLRLSRFRDEYLLFRPWGKVFVKFYYLISPPFAAILDRLQFLKPAVRTILRAVLRFLLHRF